MPFFIVYRRKAVPYFIALIQHPLVSDFVAGGRIQLFWPLTRQYFGLETKITSLENVALELALFAVSMIVMVKADDVKAFFKPSYSNLILAVPTFTVLLPMFASFPLYVPFALIFPHLVFMVLFLAAIAVSLFGVFRKVLGLG